jgi:hypothetical protein
VESPPERMADPESWPLRAIELSSTSPSDELSTECNDLLPIDMC